MLPPGMSPILLLATFGSFGVTWHKLLTLGYLMQLCYAKTPDITCSCVLVSSYDLWGWRTKIGDNHAYETIVVYL